MSSIEKTRGLAAEALGEQVACAVVAYRRVHPTAIVIGCIALGAVVAAVDRSWTSLAVAYLAFYLVYLLSRPTVVLARTHSGIVVLRSTLLRPSRPSAHVADRFDPATLVEVGPKAFAYRPLTVGHHRYWVHWVQGASAEQLARPSDEYTNAP